MYKIIKIEDIKTDLLNWKFVEIDKEIDASLEYYGPLNAILCLKLNNEYQLIDGFKRLTIFKEKNIPTLKIYIPPCPEDIHLIIRSIHYKNIIKSAILKVRWIQAFKEDLKPNDITGLKIPYYSHLYTDIKRILSLSETAQFFCHAKQYTFKELVHLIHHNIPLLETLILDANAFQYSKQAFYKTVSQSYDLLKRHQWTHDQLFEAIEYNTIKTNKNTPQQRTKQLLKNLKNQISPIHQKINQDMATKTELIKEKTDISVQYDTTLETPGIKISKHIHSINELKAFQDQLSDPLTQNNIESILNTL